MIGNRLYVAHKTNNLFSSYIEAMDERENTVDEYLSIEGGVYSIRGIQVVSMQNSESIRGIPRMYFMIDVALLAYEDSRTNSEFKVVTTTVEGKVVPDTKREMTSRFQYELSVDELKQAIDGGLYDNVLEYETKLTEQLRSTVFKDETANIRVRLYELEQEQIVRIVNEHAYLTKIASKQNVELDELLKTAMQTVAQMKKEGKHHEVDYGVGIDTTGKPTGEVMIELSDLLETNSEVINAAYTVAAAREEVKEITIDEMDKLDLNMLKAPELNDVPSVKSKENKAKPARKSKVESSLEL